MKASQQTIQQLQRAIRKVADKFPATHDALLTDIHLQVKPDSGELLAYDDDMQELTRIVVDEWLHYTADDIYDTATTALRHAIANMRSEVEAMSIMRPFSFVLMNEEGDTLHDLYLVDDDIQLLDTELLAGLDKELDDFLRQLLEE